MSRSIIIIVLLLISSPLISQWNYVQADDFPNGRVDDLFFLDELNGFWCTGGGQIFKTTDGETASLVLLANVYFRSIEFMDDNTGFAGTLDNAMYKTIDAGETWDEIELGFTAPGICGMHAINDQILWASGAWFEPAYLIKTTDAGENWEYIDMGEHASALVDIHFVDENIGFTTGYNDQGATILKTIDGGSTWNEVFNNDVPGSYVWKIDDLHNDSDVIYVSIEHFSGEHSDMAISYDQGETWTGKAVPAADHQGIGFVNENHGWVGGHDFTTYETLDGGDTWEAIPIVTGLNRVFVVNSETVYAGGHALYRYTDTSIGLDESLAGESIKPNVNFYPNPISSEFDYSIKVDRGDNLIVFLADTQGRKIKFLKRDRLNAGTTDYTFNIDVPNGEYLLITHLNGSFRADHVTVVK